MSRSYKFPCVKDNKKGTKKGKQAANRWLRRSGKAKGHGRYLEPPTNGCNYKKYYCSWDICDYKFRYIKLYKHSWAHHFGSLTEAEYEEKIKKYSRK